MHKKEENFISLQVDKRTGLYSILWRYLCKIGLLLSRSVFQTIFHLPIKLSQMLGSVRDDLGLWTPGGHHISYQWGLCYIGQMGQKVMNRIKEHNRCIKYNFCNKSAVVQHRLEKWHRIHFDTTAVLCKPAGYRDRIYRESIKIYVEKQALNSVIGFW